MRICAYLFCPFAESVSVPLHILLVVGWHMLFYCTVLVGSAVKSSVGADAIPVKEDLNREASNTDIHFLLYVLIWHGVVHLVHRNVVVWCNGGKGQAVTGEIHGTVIVENIVKSFQESAWYHRQE